MTVSGSRFAVLFAVLAAIGGAAGLSLAGQVPAEGLVRGAQLPFGAGERAEYQVKLGAVRVGSGSMEILGVEEVQGHATYHASFRLSGGIPLARVNDKLDSWIDVNGLFSRRFRQDVKEVRYRRFHVYDFFPESRTYRRTDNGETGTIPTDRPLDDVSFLYYVRTLPLRVGDEYTVPRYFKANGNPVVIKVLRRETVTVPAGTFHTVVVRPIIRTKGLFGKGGEAEVYFSDDDRRILVQLRSKVPVVGSLTMHLQTYRSGAAPVTRR